MLAPKFALPLAAVVLAILVAGSAYAFADRGSSESAPVRVADGGRSAQALRREHADGDDSLDANAARKASLFAAEFGVTAESVMAQRAQGVGWGALFQLYAIARAQGVSVASLLATVSIDADGEPDSALGELKKSLTSDQRAGLEDDPRNLGQLVSASRRKHGQ